MIRKQYKWIFAGLLAVIVLAFGFTFTVKEGTAAIVSRFGEVQAVHMDSGLHFKLPWPFEKVISYDTRNQYMDSGLVETLTNDKKNIIMQTYMVWRIEDPLKFYTSVGSSETADRYLNDLMANAKNGVMGRYELSALVSTDLSQIRISEISEEIEAQVAEQALETYGIGVDTVKIKRLALPEANLTSVFQQMIAERQKYTVQLISEGERDAAIIISNADAQAAEIVSEGKLQAAEIDAETERMVAEIYGEVYERDSELFTFLRKLIALENSVDENTVIVMRSDDSPFEILDEMP